MDSDAPKGRGLQALIGAHRQPAALPRDGFLVEEISQAGFADRFAFPVYHPRGYESSAYQENLGIGFNTAFGVMVAKPDKVVVPITRVGGFMFGTQERATAAQHGIGVVDNGAFGNMRRDQETACPGRLIDSDLENPVFVVLAQSFGIAAERTDTPEALQTALRRAIDRNEPALIAVRQERSADGSPWPFLHPAPHA